MIKIRNLTKIYKNKKLKDTIALNDINLDLPDKGLVFIIGKSGSGKSTLLNCLAGLDKITMGEIVCDGNDLSEFDRSDYTNYRANYVGFIFQHYFLIDDLTIKQNIELSLDIVEKQIDIESLLKLVDLEGYQDRYPAELSGGQKQRVAIARAMAKEPQIILGDEPTGNLDKKTSIQILEILKEISKERLVVIVSHNLDEADLYADRIIQLEEGRVISDKEKTNLNTLDFEVKDNKIYLPHYRDLEKEETDKFTEALVDQDIEDIIQKDNGFIDTTNVSGTDRKFVLEKKSFNLKKIIKYSAIFLKKRRIQRIATVVMTTLLILASLIISTFLTKSYEKPVYNEEQQHIKLVKGSLQSFQSAFRSGMLYSIDDYDIEEIESIYDGNKYLLYTTNARVGNSGSTIYNHNSIKSAVAIEKFYSYELFGVLNCDKEFLIKQYGVDGELKVLAGDLYDNPAGIVITDYIADSYIKLREANITNYDDLIGMVTASNLNYQYINAVIDTNYEEKYKEIINEYENKKPSQTVVDLQLSIFKRPIYEEFINEVMSYLGIGYNLSDNYVESLKEQNIFETYGTCALSLIGDINYKGEDDIAFGINKNKVIKVNDGEILLPYTLYNEIFNTKYTNNQKVDPLQVTLELYSTNQEDKKTIYSKSFTVIGLSETRIEMTQNDLKETVDGCVIPFGIYLENTDNIEEVLDELSDNYFYTRCVEVEAFFAIGKIVDSFKPFFNFVLGGVYMCLVVYLLLFSYNNIKRNYFEIGIMQSLGARTRNILTIFITDLLLTGIYTFISTIIFLPLLIKVCDSFMVSAFAKAFDLLIYDLVLLETHPLLIFINLVLVAVVIILAVVVITIYLLKLKPIEVINAKDKEV